MNEFDYQSETPQQNTAAPLSWWRRLVQPSATLTEVGARRQAQLLLALSLTFVFTSLSGVLGTLSSSPDPGNDISVAVLTGLSVVSLLAALLSRRRNYMIGSYLFLGGLSLAMMAQMLGTTNDLTVTVASFLPFILVLSIALLPFWAAAILAIINLLAAYLAPVILAIPFDTAYVIIVGTLTALAILALVTLAFRNTVERDRLAVLSRTNEELENLRAGLDDQVRARTQELALTIDISHRLSQISDPKMLATAVVEQIQDAFGYYHTQIYLVDEKDFLLMAGGTGSAGRAMLREGHKLQLGQGLVGETAVARKPALVPDVSQDKTWLPNPLLPDTKAEAAIPIMLGDNVLGVLDVQHDKQGVLNQGQVDLLMSIANQVAVALQNARQLEAVRESEERFALAAAGTNDGIWDWNISTDEVYFSPRWKEMIGYEDHEIAADFDEFERRLHPEDHDRVMQNVTDYLEGKVPTYEAEFRLQHKDGSYRWILVRGTVQRDANGAPVRMTGSHTDISARKESEVALQAAQERTEQVLESINVPLVISKISDGTVAYVNDPLADVIRESREALLGQVTPDFYQDPADRQGYLMALRHEGRVSNYEIPLRRKDGEPFWALVSGQIINFQGEPAIITSVVDVTERREAQAAVAQRAAELQTVADVSATVATSLEEEKLLQSVVDLAKERFNLYHAHIYLLDEDGENLVLAAGAGSVGLQMVAEGRSIPLAQAKSLVARAARSWQGVIINDVQADPGFLPNPLLPDTRAEMAVPMVAGDRLIGVLDVQADEVDHFTEQDVQIQTTLAAQTAVALQNARQYEATGAALEAASTFRQLVAASAQGIAIVDLDGNVVYLNPGLIQIGGIQDPAALIGRPIYPLYPPDVQSRFRNEILPEVMAQGQWQGELRLAVGDREVPTFENYFLLRDEQGNPAQFAAIISDITAQKEAEAIIARNQTQLQSAMRVAQLANWQFDMATQSFFLNEQAYELLGTNAEAEGGYSLSLPEFMDKFVYTADRDLLTATVQGLLANPERQAVDSEIRMTRADGALRYMLIRFAVGEIAGDQVASLTGTVQDVSAQKEAELQQAKLAQELEEQLEQVNALQRAMTREGWEAFLTATERPVQGFMFAGESLQPVGAEGLPEHLAGTSLDLDEVREITFDSQKTAVSMPLDLHGETIGVIGARSETGEPLSEEQQELLSALSAQVAEALERARLFEETELGRQRLDAQAQQLTVINEVAETVAQQLNAAQVLENVYERVQQVIPADAFVIGLYDASRNMLHYPMVYDEGQRYDEPPEQPVPGSYMKHVLETGEPVLINHGPGDGEVLTAGSAKRPDSAMFVPLRTGTSVTGAISLQNYRDYKYTDSDLQLLGGIANHVSVALENARMFTAAQRRAEREALLNTINQKLQNAPTIERALQTAVSELGLALKVKQAQVKLYPKRDTADAPENGSNGHQDPTLDS